jgi:hypothetical protein
MIRRMARAVAYVLAAAWLLYLCAAGLGLGALFGGGR